MITGLRKVEVQILKKQSFLHTFNVVTWAGTNIVVRNTILYTVCILMVI